MVKGSGGHVIVGVGVSREGRFISHSLRYDGGGLVRPMLITRRGQTTNFGVQS